MVYGLWSTHPHTSTGLFIPASFSVSFFTKSSTSGTRARVRRYAVTYILRSISTSVPPASLGGLINSLNRRSKNRLFRLFHPKDPSQTDLHVSCALPTPLTHVSSFASSLLRYASRLSRFIKLVAAALVPARPSAALLPIKA